MSQNKYALQITNHAEKDLNRIIEYISQDLLSPQAAENTISKIESAIDRICDFPLSCPLASDAYLKAKGYRMLVAGNYNVFYRFNNDTVFIMRVLYGKQSYENMF